MPRGTKDITESIARVKAIQDHIKRLKAELEASKKVATDSKISSE